MWFWDLLQYLYTCIVPPSNQTQNQSQTQTDNNQHNELPSSDISSDSPVFLQHNVNFSGESSESSSEEKSEIHADSVS